MDGRTVLEEVYVEYLACSVGAVTATELARLRGGPLRHDQITRALAGPARGARELWAKVKGLVRAAEQAADGQGVLSIDDTILAKPHREESGIVGWHFDHTVNRAVKGLNRLTPFWQGASTRLPVGDALVQKRAAAPGERPKPVTDKHPLFRDLAGRRARMRAPFGRGPPTAGLPARRTWNGSTGNSKALSSLRSRATDWPGAGSRTAARHPGHAARTWTCRKTPRAPPPLSPGSLPLSLRQRRVSAFTSSTSKQRRKLVWPM